MTYFLIYICTYYVEAGHIFAEGGARQLFGKAKPP